MQHLLPICLTLAACVLSPCLGQSYQKNKWWMDQPYGDDSYNQRAVYLDNITLECTDNRLPVNTSFVFHYWVLPDLEVLKVGGTEKREFYTLDGWAQWVVYDNNYKLEVVLVQERQFGFYHCYLENNETGEDYVVKVGLNYQGAYFTDLWAKYELNVIIACSAAGGLLLIIIIIYVIWRFRYNEEDEAEEGLMDGNSMGTASKASVKGVDDLEAGGPQQAAYNHYEPEPTADYDIVKDPKESGVEMNSTTEGYSNGAFDNESFTRL